MKNRIISVLLVLCTLVSICNFSLDLSVDAEEHYTVYVMADGENTERIIVPESSKKEITAICSPANEQAKYQWQICADLQSELWVDICDANTEKLNVSYAMLSSLLDASGSAYIRAKLTVNKRAYYSNPICATIAFNAKLSDTKPMDTKPADTAPKTPSIPKKTLMKIKGMLGLEPPEYVTITINYLDWETKREVYSPYSATILSGSNFNQIIVSPTFLGYEPKLWDGLEDFSSAPQYEFNLENVTSNVVVNVYYKAINVNYAVSYYFQNVNNDLYTEKTELYRIAQAETGTIVTNEVLAEGAGDTVGFSKLYHYPESVAADGSTVFECYYDRNYYFYRFDLDGGYGVDPIYARYGTPFVVAQPVRHGYVFSGWADVTDDPENTTITSLPTNIGFENKKFKAIWETVDTTYTVVYWLENADDENGAEEGNGYSYWCSETKEAISNTTVTGEDNKNLPMSFKTDPLHINEVYYSEYHHADGEKLVEGDGSTVVNVYYNRKEYQLRFYYAMESPTGDYYVVGGSTYYFGHRGEKASGVINNDEISLIDQYFSRWTGHIGQVDALPALNENGSSKGYTEGSVTSTNNNYKYHYISFSAKYGSNIGNKWPSDVFDSVLRINPITNNGNDKWTSKVSYVAGWNGEYNVKYSCDNTNETIKGKYAVLNENLLWKHEDYGEPSDNVVSYLCFWENGAAQNWSVPKIYQYKIWLPVTPNTAYDESAEQWNPNATALGSNTGTNLTDAEKEAIVGIDYYLADNYITYDDSFPNQQTQPGLVGFTKINMHSWKVNNAPEVTSNLVNEYIQMNMFYTRNEYYLRFTNYGNILISSSLTPYDKDISSTYFVPSYPSTLEPNAYYFDGWYTTPECFEGSEYSLENATMPAKNLTLYAKWKPKTHTVRFFATYDDMLTWEAEPNKELVQSLVLGERPVEHGKTAGEVETPVNPHIHDYTFAGWFFITTGNENHMFTQFDTLVNRDMNVYASWGSKTASPYRIHYALYSHETEEKWTNKLADVASPINHNSYTVTVDSETRTYIYVDGHYHRAVADDTSGYAYEGSTRTFSAKAGDPYNQLYSDYNNGYFPTLSSHSITMASEITGIEQPQNNVFTFFYVQPGAEIKYKVRYLDKKTNLPLESEKTLTTPKSVVTERFLPINGYIPDAFYKRLILSVVDDGHGNWIGSAEDNVITFYYMKNTTAAYYAVHHMLQSPNTDGTHKNTTGVGDYTEDDSVIEGIADIGTNVEITPLTFDGFTVYDPKPDGKLVNDGTTDISSDVNGKFTIPITKDGTELYIYYTRNKYDVVVKYYEYNTTNPVDPDHNPITTYEDREFGTVVSHEAPLIFSTSTDWSLVDPANKVKSTLVRSNEEQNVIIFYYVEKKYDVLYRIAGGMGGNLSKDSEEITTSESIQGCTATAADGFAFIGWYLDEECTISASSKAEVTDAYIKPTFTYLNPAPAHNIFYAKFKQEYSDLTITRNNAIDESNGNQIFVYKITQIDTPTNIYYVTVQTNNAGFGTTTIKNLPGERYIVEQMNDWSWRYADAAKTVDLHVDKNILFDSAAVNDKWLNGNSEVIENKKNG